MSSPPYPRTLEGLVDDEWGRGTSARHDVMALLEPHRVDVENLMGDFDDDTQSWRDYSGCIWGYRGEDGAIPREVIRQVDKLVTDELVKQPAPADRPYLSPHEVQAIEASLPHAMPPHAETRYHQDKVIAYVREDCERRRLLGVSEHAPRELQSMLLNSMLDEMARCAGAIPGHLFRIAELAYDLAVAHTRTPRRPC